MVEGGTLLRCYTSNGVSRVRIPPPPLSFLPFCRINPEVKEKVGTSALMMPRVHVTPDWGLQALRMLRVL